MFMIRARSQLMKDFITYEGVVRVTDIRCQISAARCASDLWFFLMKGMSVLLHSCQYEGSTNSPHMLNVGKRRRPPLDVVSR